MIVNPYTVDPRGMKGEWKGLVTLCIRVRINCIWACFILEDVGCGGLAPSLLSQEQIPSLLRQAMLARPKTFLFTCWVRPGTPSSDMFTEAGCNLLTQGQYTLGPIISHLSTARIY